MMSDRRYVVISAVRHSIAECCEGCSQRQGPLRMAVFFVFFSFSTFSIIYINLDLQHYDFIHDSFTPNHVPKISFFPFILFSSRTRDS